MLWTIGHSTRPLDEFTSLLRENGVTRLVDVRALPRSRYNPQYNGHALRTSLPAAGIAYDHRPELGGHRMPRPDSPNLGFKEEAFRGYADYMQTAEFDAALTALMEQGGQSPLAIMCAEADPLHCHRRLISDALTLRGVEVRHIMRPGETRVHALTGFAHVEGTRITYPFSLEG